MKAKPAKPPTKSTRARVSRDHCRSCGTRWTKHGGIEVTCARLYVVHAALQAILDLEGGLAGYGKFNERLRAIARSAIELTGGVVK